MANIDETIRYVDLLSLYGNLLSKTQKEVFGLEGGPLHDPLTIACLLDDKILHFERMDVEVDISDSITYGQTRCKPNKESYIQVATGIDVDLFFDYIEKALRSC